MDKQSRLKESNTFNTNSDKITARIFADNRLMDPQDLLQVRYEMVRAIECEDRPIREICEEYGVSPSTARRYRDDLRRGGLIALVPEQKGPSGPTKLTKEAAEFIDAYLDESPGSSGGKIHNALESRLHLGLSKRTVERYLSKKGQGG